MIHRFRPLLFPRLPPGGRGSIFGFPAVQMKMKTDVERFQYIENKNKNMIYWATNNQRNGLEGWAKAQMTSVIRRDTLYFGIL